MARHFVKALPAFPLTFRYKKLDLHSCIASFTQASSKFMSFEGFFFIDPAARDILGVGLLCKGFHLF